MPTLLHRNGPKVPEVIGRGKERLSTAPAGAKNPSLRFRAIGDCWINNPVKRYLCILDTTPISVR